MHPVLIILSSICILIFHRDNPILKGSRASLASSRKTISDDEISLNDYGDIDAGKFTEDGSFIGDYGNRAYV